MTATGEKTLFLRRASRFASAPGVYRFLIACAARRSRITYGDLADEFGLGSPRGLGWLLTPLLAWCETQHLPPLPIIVVRRADGLPSGGYDHDAVALETERVFDHPWSRQLGPSAADLLRHALPRLPASLRGTPTRQEHLPC